jgi:hypothetical protein
MRDRASEKWDESWSADLEGSEKEDGFTAEAQRLRRELKAKPSLRFLRDFSASAAVRCLPRFIQLLDEGTNP